MTVQPVAADFFALDNSYARLPERFFARLSPTPVTAPHLIRLNENLARQLGLDPAKLSSAEGLDVLAGNRVPQSSLSLAMADGNVITSPYNITDIVRPIGQGASINVTLLYNDDEGNGRAPSKLILRIVPDDSAVTVWSTA